MILNAVLIPFVVLLLLHTACTKIEQTSMGGDLIPVVDNITTFDTLLQVIANNYIPEDSTRLNQSADHLVGGIHNDPLFGSTRATLFFQMMPTIFPFTFSDSTTFFDSAVLILRYRGYYGDSTEPLTFHLYESDRKILPDTALRPTYSLQPDLGVNRSRFWGAKTMRAFQYKDSVSIVRGDSIYGKVNNELRIPLTPALALALFRGDSTIYGSDSLFTNFLPGFALEAQGNPNAIHYFSLGQGSEIDFYYRLKRGDVIDTTSFAYGVTFRSGHAVALSRQRNGAELTNFLTPNEDVGASQVYIQATPGTMASIRIPGIDVLTNRIIHRAELRVVELPENNPATSQLIPPTALYLDAEEKSRPGVFRGIPYDLSPFTPYFCYPAGGVDFNLFGGFPSRETIDGNPVNVFRFNLTRYIQSVITRREPSYNFRLSAPYYMFYNDCVNSINTFPPQYFPFTSGTTHIVPVADGRVRVAGGSHPDARYRMQLRIIYSKI